jgi:peptide/nickel transport system substrate-binding protein
MAKDKPGKWSRLPKVNLNFDHKLVIRKMRHAEGATIKHAHKFIIKRWGNIREVQRHVIIWSLIMGTLIAATGLQLMWYQQSYRTTTSAVDGTYAEAVLGPINTLNPLFAVTSAEQSASSLIFSRLVRYDDSGAINYDLATNVSISDSDTKYTVDIRPDVKWSDGHKLTARDVAFTIDLMKNPSTRSVISGWEDIKVTVLSDYQIEFKLSSTYAAFMHALNFSILPEHLLNDVVPSNLRESNFSQNPVGSGPFKFKFTQDVELNSARKVIYLERNNNFYNGKIKLSRFQLHVYETTEQIVRALNTSEVNAAADLSPVEIKSINKNRYTTVSSPIQSGLYALLNKKSNLLGDKNIRQALQLGTDTNSIRKSLIVDTKPLDLPFTTGQLTGDVPKAPLFNEASANNLLEGNNWKLNKDGIREKSGVQLKLSVVTLKNSESENALELLAKQWHSIGVLVETHVIDLSDVAQNTAQTILQARNFDVLIYELNIGADPDVYAYWHSSQTSLKGLNFANYSNVIADDALTSARSRLDMQLRNAKYLTFTRQWLEDVPAIGLYQISSIYVINKDTFALKEGAKLVSAVDRYSNIVDWSVGTRSVYKTP